MKTKKYIFIAAAASMLGMTTSCDDEGFLTESRRQSTPPTTRTKRLTR